MPKKRTFFENDPYTKLLSVDRHPFLCIGLSKVCEGKIIVKIIAIIIYENGGIFEGRKRALVLFCILHRKWSIHIKCQHYEFYFKRERQNKNHNIL
jgi:hypothetical protein